MVSPTLTFIPSPQYSALSEHMAKFPEDSVEQVINKMPKRVYTEIERSEDWEEV